MQLTLDQRYKAASIAIYVAAAEDLLAAADQSGMQAPSLNLTTLEVCWETVWQFRADDDADWVQELRTGLHLGQDNYFYGLLLRCTKALPDIGFVPGDLLAVIRGTGTAKEWILNLCAFLETDQTTIHHQAGMVPDGFYSIYKNMAAYDPTGKQVDLAATALAGLLKPSGPQLLIAGHSLGAALVSYLVYDVANAVRADGGFQAATRLNLLQTYMFACPNPGNNTYIAGFQAAVPSYNVINWSRDQVPGLPPPPLCSPIPDGGPASPLQNLMTLTPQNVTWMPADALDPFCNHHAICYARMLDPINPIAIAQTTTAGC